MCDVQVRTCAGMGVTGRCVCTFSVLVSLGAQASARGWLCEYTCVTVHWMWVCSVACVAVWLAVFAHLSVCLLTHIACVFLRDVGCGLRPSVLLWAVSGPGLWSLLAG